MVWEYPRLIMRKIDQGNKNEYKKKVQKYKYIKSEYYKAVGK